MIGRLLADVTPLRESADFRRLWAGTSLSAVGSQMTVFAVALQVFRLTGSSAAVGGVGLVSGGCGVIAGLLGGGIIDAVDRRRLVLVMSSLQLLLSVLLAVQAFVGGVLWPLYLLVGAQAAVGAVNAPARKTFAPRLLPGEQLPAAAALSMLGAHTAVVIGPALAGVITAAGGLRFCYVIDAVSFLASMYGVSRLPAMRPEGGERRAGVAAVVAGLAFVRRTPVLAGVLLADVSATLLAMPVALFPAIDAQRFGGNTRVLGLMSTALAAGGIVGSGLSGPVGRLAHQGRGVLVAGAVWGLALAGFGAVHGAPATLALLAVAGAADVSSVVLRSTIVQTLTPDALRGRVSATDFVVGSSCPQLGNFRAGAVATAWSPGLSATSGGLAAVVGAAGVALCFPALWRYRRDRAPDPVGVPAAG